jgi:hypothetical protein
MKHFIFLVLVNLFAISSFAQIKSKAYNCTAYGANDGWIDLHITGGTPPYRYQWSNGSTDEDIFNLISGRYTVTVYDASNFCKIEVSFDVAQPDLKNSEVSKRTSSFTSRFDVFPNPTETNATINFYTSEGQTFSLRVYDINGRVILNESRILNNGDYTRNIDFTNQPKGFYFVEVVSEKETITKRLVVQ